MTENNELEKLETMFNNVRNYTDLNFNQLRSEISFFTNKQFYIIAKDAPKDIDISFDPNLILDEKGKTLILNVFLTKELAEKILQDQKNEYEIYRIDFFTIYDIVNWNFERRNEDKLESIQTLFITDISDDISENIYVDQNYIYRIYSTICNVVTYEQFVTEHNISLQLMNSILAKLPNCSTLIPAFELQKDNSYIFVLNILNKPKHFVRSNDLLKLKKELEPIFSKINIQGYKINIQNVAYDYLMKYQLHVGV